MVAVPAFVRTVRDLMARTAPCGPAAEYDELLFATDPPPELVPLLRVLHTGVRAVLTGRRWWGATSDGKPRVVELCPDAPIPAGIGLLCVEGDARWDRIAPAARCDLPHLFAPTNPAGSARRGHGG